MTPEEAYHNCDDTSNNSFDIKECDEQVEKRVVRDGRLLICVLIGGLRAR